MLTGGPIVSAKKHNTHSLLFHSFTLPIFKLILFHLSPLSLSLSLFLLRLSFFLYSSLYKSPSLYSFPFLHSLKRISLASSMAEEETLLVSNPDDLKQEEGEDDDEEEEEEEEEALSLCDLPLNNEETNSCKEAKSEPTQLREIDEEFNFGSKESEMCTADEVFFQGQILPLRLSVSSESGLTNFQQENRHSINRCLSRSESMDHGSSTGSTSINSSRSSSTRSYYSSTTTSSSLSSKQQKLRNNFHSCPSPSPQIRVSSFRLSNVGNSSSRTQKSTIWDLFRVGLVRAPEIELQDLKNRNSKNGCVSRNSSSGSSSSNSRKESKQSKALEKRIGSLFNLGGCKCSIDAVEAVPLNKERSVVVIGNREETKKEPKKKKQRKKKEEGKREMSRHRTFEWLKELSHGSSYVLVDDQI